MHLYNQLMSTKNEGDLTMRTIDPDSFLSGGNAPYIIEMFHRFKSDPSSISSDWSDFFKAYESDLNVLMNLDDRPPRWSKATGSASLQPGKAFTPDAIRDSIRALMFIRSYRVRGHLHAQLDPLGMDKRPNHQELLPQTYGFTQADMGKHVYVDRVLGLDNPTIGEIYDKVRAIYCQTIGVEFMHIQEADQKSWIQERVENTPVEARVDDADRLAILKSLIAGDSFERFLHVKYPGAKRFGLEGGESLIPSLEALVERLSNQGVDKIVFGMAHRGRLSVLANIIQKPFANIFAQFQGGEIDPASVHGSGDVKYHMGYSNKRTISGRDMDLSLMHNPSHLEAVNPVVQGKVRAEQDIKGDQMRRRTVSVLMHGDAAFAGQGLVAECLDLSNLKGYLTGGTIHIIINNQIGFTTSPPHSRSSPYSSDVAKAIQAPIIHVNGDDPEAVVWAMRVATDFHRQFSLDVVLDLVCYRRHGHNEIDEPSFTQPLMYKKIASHPTTFQIYSQKLVQSCLVTQDQVDEMVADYENKLRQEFDGLTQEKTNTLISQTQWLGNVWTGIQSDEDIDQKADMCPQTGVEEKILRTIAEPLAKVPDSFHVNSRLNRVMTARKEAFQGEGSLDWAMGEALSFGSLLLEGKRVRLSGQDVGRGTFSHRHAVWVDQETEQKYVALNHIAPTQATFEVVDSPLAEASVLGFEYGYSLADPHSLVLWEAQFGDFSNGAQVIIDQFISSGEHKWQRLSGLVMLLPHGYEGQGPEHSSARPERYLQLCAENNMRVVNCTTPANYFHVLRRQLLSQTRKPLIVMSPKSLLRHKLAVSTYSDISLGTTFLPVISDKEAKAKSVKRVVLCSGKVYYDLIQENKLQKNADTVAIIRLEQYYPFPSDHLADALKPYVGAEFIWCQEEPMNMGAWTFLDRRLEAVLISIGAKNTRFEYAGRPESASPATGNTSRHETEQKVLIAQALGLK